MRRASLGLAVLLLAACSSSTTTSSPSSAPTTTTAVVGTTSSTTVTTIPATSTTLTSTTVAPTATVAQTTATTVSRVQRYLAGKTLLDTTVAIAQACGAPDPTCIRAEVEKRGLPATVADNFNDLGGQFITGLVIDRPSFALVVVTDPWKVNSNETYAVIGGIPTVQFVNDRLDLIARELPDTFGAFTSMPGIAADAYQASFVASTVGATETGLTFVVPLINGCRACGLGIGAPVTVWFDASGRESRNSITEPCSSDLDRWPEFLTCPEGIAGS